MKTEAVIWANNRRAQAPPSITCKRARALFLQLEVITRKYVRASAQNGREERLASRKRVDVFASFFLGFERVEIWSLTSRETRRSMSVG